MPLSDNQFSFGGVTMGAGTKYKVNSVRGVRGVPDVESHDTPKGQGSGSFAGFDTVPDRVIEMSITITGTSAADFESLLAALETAMAVQSTTTGAWKAKYPSKSEMTIQVRPRRMSVPTLPTQGKFWAQCELQWVAPDPTFT